MEWVEEGRMVGERRGTGEGRGMGEMRGLQGVNEKWGTEDGAVEKGGGR